MPLRVLLIMYAGVVGSTVIDYRSLRPVRMGRRPWEVIDNRDEVRHEDPAGHSGGEAPVGQCLAPATS